MSRELKIFLLVGGLTVLVDFIFYQACFRLMGLSPAPAKALGFAAGTVFAYFCNRYWTFQHVSSRRGSAGRFALLYAVTWLVNVAINSAGLAVLGGWVGGMAVAFGLATAVSATLNFFGMRFFVFTAARAGA